MGALDSLQPRKSAPGEDLSQWLHPSSRRTIKHAAFDISHALGGGPVPPECCTAVSTEVARHGVARIGGGGILLGRASDSELRRGHNQVEAEG